MNPISYNEKVILEQLERLHDWWYSIEEFAYIAGYGVITTRYMLDRLCRKKYVVKLIDAEGEGYYLTEEDK